MMTDLFVGTHKGNGTIHGERNEPVRGYSKSAKIGAKRYGRENFVLPRAMLTRVRMIVVQQMSPALLQPQAQLQVQAQARPKVRPQLQPQARPQAQRQARPKFQPQARPQLQMDHQLNHQWRNLPLLLT